MPSSVASRRKSVKAVRAPPPLAAITGSNKAAQRHLSASAARPGDADVPVAAKAQQRPSQTQVAVAQPNNKPDVFQFLQQGDSSSSTPSDTDSEEQEHDEDEKDDDDDDDDDEDDEEDEEKPTNKPRSPTSSRIVRRSDLPSPVSSSFRASSPEQTFSVASRDSISTDPEPTTPPDGSPATAYLRLAHKHITQSRGQRRRVSSREDYQQSDYSAPEDYYIPSGAQSRRLSSLSSAHEGAGTLVQTNKNKSPAKKNTRRATISGYASLASKLDSSDKDTTNNKLAPVYRRFENVNHRILLYLQDEISQMEEELQLMDEYDATHRASIAEEDGSHPEPASRRMDVEAARHFSGFHARRTELLERLMYKTNQYSKFLLTLFPGKRCI
jgi:hypothetical protein